MGVSAGWSKRASTALVITLLLLIASLVVPSSARAGSTAYFVFLGDIWSYDRDSGAATVFEPAAGRALGNVVWSDDNRTVAWVEAHLGDFGDWVVIRESVSTASPVTHRIGGTNPDVSPDGRRVAFERWSFSGVQVVVYDVVTRTEQVFGSEIVNPAWAGHADRLSYNGNYMSFPESPGFAIEGLTPGGGVIVISAYYAGLEAVDQSNAWGPQWSPVALPGAADPGRSVALTKYVAGTGEVHLVSMAVNPLSGAWAMPGTVMDLTGADSSAYRWIGNTGADVSLLVEFVPTGEVLPTISTSTTTDHIPKQFVPFLRRSSFEFAASVPPGGDRFSDVPASDGTYSAAINGLAAGWVIEGYDDGTFRPNNKLWRAQFAKILVGGLDIPVDESLTAAPFTDLGPDDPGSLYPHDYVGAAYQNGITKGKTATTFSPYGNVTRAQVMTMVVRAADRLEPSLLLRPVKASGSAFAGFTDPAHGENARIAEANGLLSGIELSGWNPWSPASRAEAAQIVYNLMQLRGPVIR